MRIGIEVSTLGNRKTGTNRYLTCLLEQIESTGNTIIKLSASEKKLLGFSTGKKGSSLQKHLYRNFLLTNELISSNTDCAIFPDYIMPSGYKQPSAIVIHDLSFISHPHFYSQKFVRYYNYQIKQTLKQNPIVVAVSEHTRKNITKYLGVRTEDIVIVQGYSNIKSGLQANYALCYKERPYFLYVGHIEPRKNINFMIEGFLKWKRQYNNNYKLKIVGALWINSPEIIRMFKTYTDHPDIEFTGYIDENLLAGIFSNAAGFIHTSFEEGFGFPVLEAMHYGLPVICSQNIATAEISRPQSITIDPTDTRGYIIGLDKLFEKVTLNKKINYNIKYSPALMEEQLGNLICKLESRVKRIFDANIPKAKTKIEALEKTFIYSSLFNAGIRKENLHKQIFDVKIEKNELQKFINLLTLEGIIKENRDLIYLDNGKEGYYKCSKKRINKSKLVNILNFLNRLPFISCIAFSGGTTHYGLENHDDIDLFIITKPYALYIVYLIIHLYAILTDSRKELCVNYLIDENDMTINHSYDFYTAHQIISLTAYKNYRMLNKFFRANEWVKNYYPNFTLSNDISKRASVFYSIMKPMNNFLMHIYRRMYRNKLQLFKATNSILLTEHTIKLHTNEHKFRIIKEFEDTWREYCRNNHGDRLQGINERLKVAAS